MRTVVSVTGVKSKVALLVALGLAIPGPAQASYAGWLKDMALQRLSDRVGRQVFVDGDIDVDLSRTPPLRVEGVRIVFEPSWLRYVASSLNTDVTARLRSEALESGGQQILISADGRFRGEAIELNFYGASPLAMRNPEKPYPLELVLAVAETELKVAGPIRDPLTLQGLDLDHAISGTSPSLLSPLLNFSLPELPPNPIEGELTRDGHVVSLHDSSGAVGDSDAGGDIRVDPLEFCVGGGEIRSVVQFDTNATPFSSAVDGEIRRVRLDEVLAPFEIADESLGVVGGRLKMWVRGDSVAEMIASADGGVFVAMTGVKLDILLTELGGFDIGESLGALVGDADTVPIDCAYVDLLAKNGIFRVKTALLDTPDTLFLADGFVDFNQESMDLVIEPQPKDFSIFTLRSAPCTLRAGSRIQIFIPANHCCCAAPRRPRSWLRRQEQACCHWSNRALGRAVCTVAR